MKNEDELNDKYPLTMGFLKEVKNQVEALTGKKYEEFDPEEIIEVKSGTLSEIAEHYYLLGKNTVVTLTGEEKEVFEKAIKLGFYETPSKASFQDITNALNKRPEKPEMRRRQVKHLLRCVDKKIVKSYIESGGVKS